MDVSKAGVICIIYEVYVGFCWPADLKEKKIIFGLFPRILPVQEPTKL